MGDYNAVVTETCKNSCGSYFREICWENEHVSKPTGIDLKTTNQPGIFRSAKEFEASLSDFS